MIRLVELMGDTFDNNQPDFDTYSAPEPPENTEETAGNGGVGDMYVSEDDAREIYEKMGYNFDFGEFFTGMGVEMEHKDVTGGDRIMTAKIAAAHLREVPNYYTLLKKYVEK